MANQNIKAHSKSVCSNTNCLSTYSNSKGFCLACKSKMHKFDSTGESERYQYLVYQKKIHIEELQPKFPFILPKLKFKCLGRFTGILKAIGFLPFKDASSDLVYTSDFAYAHPDYPGMIAIEDYKACGKNKAGNIEIQYQGDSYLRMRIAARLYSDRYVFIVSYKYNNRYYEKRILPK